MLNPLETCVCCNGRGHRSNAFSIMRVDNLTEEREEEKERVGHAVENDKYERVEFSE